LLALTRGESRTGSAEGRPTGQPVGLTRHGNTGVIQFSKDNQVYLTVGPGDIPGGNWVSGTPGKRGGAMFMILNLAVGGDGGGPVPSDFSSATMLVDYVRVW
jgi:hypothetical protein